jgi:hypothetical protein
VTKPLGAFRIDRFIAFYAKPDGASQPRVKSFGQAGKPDNFASKVVCRLARAISIYYATRALLPAKTRVFVDFVVEVFERERLAERFAGAWNESNVGS